MTTRQFRFTDYERHVLSRALMERIAQLSRDPSHDPRELSVARGQLERLSDH